MGSMFKDVSLLNGDLDAIINNKIPAKSKRMLSILNRVVFIKVVYSIIAKV
jgi:hypothetical protein